MKVIKAAICVLSMLCISRCVCMEREIPADTDPNRMTLQSGIDRFCKSDIEGISAMERRKFIETMKEVLQRCIDNQSNEILSFMRSEVKAKVDKVRILLESFIKRNDHTEEELILMRETALVMEVFRINTKKNKIKNTMPWNVKNKLSSLFNEMSEAIYVHDGRTKMHGFYVGYDKSLMRSASVQFCEFIKEVLQHCIDNQSKQRLSFMISTIEIEEKIFILLQSFINQNDHTGEELILMRETALVMEDFFKSCKNPGNKNLGDSDDTNELKRKHKTAIFRLGCFFFSFVICIRKVFEEPKLKKVFEEHKLNKAHEELREALKKETDPFANLDNETSSDEEQYEKDKQKNEKQYALLVQQYMQ